MASEASEEESAGLDVGVLKDVAQKGLIDALNLVNGAKTLVLDPSIAGPLGLITEVSLLKQHGVDKMFWLEPGPLSSTTANVVYLCRPTIKNVKIIADHIRRHAKESLHHTYTLLLVPRVSTLAKRILEEEGVLGDVTLSSYNLQFIPLADDVISLENDAAFTELWVDGDETVVYDSAQALISLEKLFGLFPRIVGKGDFAKRLSTLLTRYLPQSRNASVPATLLAPSDKIDSIIILDRRVDMITPLLTQLTYEGLIDELMGIKNSHVELPASLLSPTPDGPPGAATSASAATLRKESKKKYHLNASDPLFAELRDLNFSLVGKALNKVARRIEEDYKTTRQAQTIPQLKDAVGKLGGLKNEHQALRLHTGLSEMLLPIIHSDLFNKSLEIQQNLIASYNINEQLAAIEDLISQGADLQSVLRLACLASIVSGGIRSKTLENLKREILQAYGYNFLPAILSLAAPPLSILIPTPLPPSTPPAVSASKLPFPSLRKSLRLLIDDNPEAISEVENDISFTYSGYAPLSIRLVQCVAQKGGVLSNPADREKDAQQKQKASVHTNKVQAHPIMGWRGFEDVLDIIPGETIDIAQNGVGANATALPSRPREKTTTTIVFFLGGCTYTEIAALRWVGRQNRGRKFLIATTNIVSGASIMNGVAGIKTAGSKDAGI